jgi:hypothetical protein
MGKWVAAAAAGVTASDSVDVQDIEFSTIDFLFSSCECRSLETNLECVYLIEDIL